MKKKNVQKVLFDILCLRLNPLNKNEIDCIFMYKIILTAYGKVIIYSQHECYYILLQRLSSCEDIFFSKSCT